MINNQGEDGLSRISQNHIAKQSDRSSSCVSTTIARLGKYDNCIEKIAPAIYKINQSDMLKYGPLPRVRKSFECIEKDISIMEKTFKGQSKLTNMSIEDIQMSQGYI